MKNTCVNCKDEWNVNLHFAKLDEIDHANIQKHEQPLGIKYK